MAITYRDLHSITQDMTPTQLDQEVIVFVTASGEFYPLLQESPICIADEKNNNELPDGYPYLVV